MITLGPCAVIAEIGVNHNGDPVLAHELIDMAAGAGADYVKFQTFSTVALAAEATPLATYQRGAGARSQNEMLAALELPKCVWQDLAAHAAERGLVFVSTPFDRASADLLDEMGVPLFKVPSGEITNLPFLRDLAARGRPLLVSTGMSTLEEVRAALDTVAEAPTVGLLHCVSAYPAPLHACNLRAIVTMREEFNVPVGWSDHTDGTISALGAIALGAAILEKHLTKDRSLPGPDHAASATPSEFADYVHAVRSLEVALGDGIKKPAPDEHDVAIAARRSWFTARQVEPGVALRADDLVALRPGTGISPAINLIGRVPRVQLAPGALVREKELDG